MVLYILCRKEACFGGDFRQEKALDRETPRASLLLTVPMDVEVDRDVGDVRSAAAAAAAATAGPASGYFRDLAVDFVGGCVSGCAGIFVGQVRNDEGGKRSVVGIIVKGGSEGRGE